ncbi:NAD(P)H dehydrogenase [Pseudomonas poae]|uniref:NAD(P)H dehydrogenase n=1 Tax=Pseudomonas poae TaxID=200451 RepID=A0A423ETV6_9PSED|nr:MULTISPECIES: NAD(P)H-dependent oxidoreductase [Pseudomonas]ROM40089.1 NAD(P)H dehydrogenase [Pseudomonas poae]TFF03328.1 flavodoxin family protein [Pseudomonas sp. JMN1]TFF05310.1 flavodoxin family protein [Pseudomonas sp. BCA17]TFF20976.1 flavodoxin family protein [Pseudomonas sp. BCA14]TFF21301.1 flavodoxin family protein [Pseudomonas sp. BCA13]
MSQRILVILGHPSSTSFCSALADTYIHGAKAAGHQIRVLRLGDLAFDPVLHHGYSQSQPLEPDLLSAQSDILWANHLTFVFPIWWGGIPALMKGFIDRVFLSGFAFKYRAGKAFPDKLLRGRTAHLLVTLDTPPWYYRWFYHMPGIHQMRKTTLGLCGIKPVKTLLFGPVLGSTLTQRAKWLKQVLALFEKGNFHVHRQSRAKVGHHHQGDSSL